MQNNGMLRDDILLKIRINQPQVYLINFNTKMYH